MTELRATFEKVQEHTRLIEEQDKTIHHEILPRLREVERLQEEVTKEMTAMRQSQTSLELTVMKENQTTRQKIDKVEDTLIAQGKDLIDIVKSTLGFHSTKTTQTHEYKMAKWNHIANLLIKGSGIITLLLGSGTSVYLIIEHYFGK